MTGHAMKTDDPNQQPIPCSDEELLDAVSSYVTTRNYLHEAQHQHSAARVRLVAAMRSRGIDTGVVS